MCLASLSNYVFNSAESRDMFLRLNGANNIRWAARFIVLHTHVFCVTKRNANEEWLSRLWWLVNRFNAQSSRAGPSANESAQDALLADSLSSCWLNKEVQLSCT